MPTIRITKEAPMMATAPLSSDKTTAGQARPLAHKSQGLPSDSHQSQISLQQLISGARQSATNVEPAEPTAPPVKQESIAQRSKTIESQKARSYKKELLIAALVLLAIFAAV